LTAWSAATAAAAVRPTLFGFLLGATLVLLPHASGEILSNIANIQWLFAPTLALVLLSEQKDGRLWWINSIAFVTIAGLTGPFSALLLPVSLWRFVRLRDAIAVIAIMTGLVQLAVIGLTPAQSVPAGPGTLGHLAQTMLARTFMPYVPNILIGGALIAISIVTAKFRTLRLGLLYFVFAIMIATFAKFRINPQALDSEFSGPRYFYPPEVALMWCAISLLFTENIGRITGAVYIAFWAMTYPPMHFRRAPLSDLHWQEHIRELGKHEITIPINPPGWIVTIPTHQ
jgi:hypothetical protein